MDWFLYDRDLRHEKVKIYRNYLKDRPGLNERTLRMSGAPLFTAEKLNEHPGLNERPPKTRKEALIWKFAMFAEAPIQIVCKNDKTRVFFSQIFFVFYKKEIYFIIYVDIDIEL